MTGPLNQKIWREVVDRLNAQPMGNWKDIGGGLVFPEFGIYVAFAHKSFGDVYPSVVKWNNVTGALEHDIKCKNVDDVIRGIDTIKKSIA